MNGEVYIQKLKRYHKKYSSLGWVVQPLKGKRPYLLEWNSLSKSVSFDEFSPTSNIGIVCGKVSDVFVLDIDKKDNGVKMWKKYLETHEEPQTVCARSGGGGYHYYFKYEDRVSHLALRNRVIKDEEGKPCGWDIKTTDGAIVLPPSVHPETKKNYKWIRSPFSTTILSIPDDLLEMISPKEKEKKKKMRINDIPLIKETEVVNPKLVRKLVEMLNDERADDYKEWIHVGLILKTLGNNKEFFAMWNKFSKRSTKYEEDKIEHDWDTLKPNGSTGLWALRCMAKEDNSAMYHALYFTPKIPVHLFYNVWHGDSAWKDIIVHLLKGKVFTTNKDGRGYLWDRVEKLWLKTDSEKLANLVCPMLKAVFLQYRRLLIKKVAHEESDDKRKSLNKKLDDLSKIIKTSEKLSVGKIIWSSAKADLKDENKDEELNKKYPHLLPILDGKVIDLKTLEIKDRKKEHLFTFECPVSLGDRNNPDVVKFFSSIMNDSKERIAYIQKVLGYCLTGETDQKSVYIMWGTRDNGKSVLLSFMEKIWKGFYTTASKDLFIASNALKSPGSATPHLMPLAKARCACFSETKEGDKLNESLLKMISGSDSISARANYGEQTSFKSSAKLILITNHRPEFTANDAAMVERICYIPFDVKFVNNPTLQNEKLRDENLIARLNINDIFAWIAYGSYLYYKDRKIIVPPSLLSAKKEYVNDVDIIQQFLDACTTEKNGNSLGSTILYQRYKDWCTDNGYKWINQKSFSSNIKSKGYEIKKDNRGYSIFKDLEILQDGGTEDN